MQKNILFVLAFNWMLVACSGAPIAPDSSPLADCKRQFPWFCRGNAQSPTVNLNTKSRKLKASPYCIDVAPGSQIRFELTPPGNKPINTVEIIPKDPSHTWLAGTNSTSEDLILINVPGDIDKDVRYYYGIKTDTECVDPRVHVE